MSSSSILKNPPFEPSPLGDSEQGEGGAVRESPLLRVLGWVSCFHKWRLRRESDLDCETSGSEREISVEIDLTRLRRGLGLRVEPSFGSSSVERDLTRLARGRWLGEGGPGDKKLAPEVEQFPREPGDDGERGTWKAWDCDCPSSSSEGVFSLESDIDG